MDMRSTHSLAKHERTHCVRWVLYLLRQALHPHSLSGRVVDLEVGLSGVEEIPHAFLVYLQEGALDSEFGSLLVLVDMLEQLAAPPRPKTKNATRKSSECGGHQEMRSAISSAPAGARDDATLFGGHVWSEHGEGLAGARLAVGEDGPVVAIENVAASHNRGETGQHERRGGGAKHATYAMVCLPTAS